MTPAEQGLVVVIPAKDEAATIGGVVRDLVTRGYAVLLVDDGSSDGTGDLAGAEGARVLRHERNQGYDASIAHGLNAAFDSGARAAVTCDADGQHRTEDLERVTAPVLAGRADFAGGVRDRYNRPVEALAGAFSRRLFGTRDPFCGLKCYGRVMFERCGPFPEALNVGSLPLAWIRRAGLKAEFLPIRSGERLDQPRFARFLRANLLLLQAFLRTWRAYASSSDRA